MRSIDRNDRLNKNALVIGCFLATVVLFHLVYGLAVLIPTNVNWLMSVRDDWGTHYLGWFFYRNEPWHFPLGEVHNYYYPVGTNVGFTDSIPLMALFFKLFKGILPADFQYFGIWLFLCHFLAGYYTILLMRLFKVNVLITFVAMLLVISNPVLIYRGMHPALCAHWLLIGGIYLYFSDPADVGVKKILTHQFILLMIAVLVNPYIALMVYGLGIATLMRLGFFDKIVNKKSVILYFAASVLCALLVWLIVGLIDLKGKGGLEVNGAYGLYGLNLDSLFNPFDFSAFLPNLKWVSWHQFESFMYLGLGVIALLLFLLLFRIYRFAKRRERAGGRRSWRVNNANVIPLLIVTLGFALFAITNVFTFGTKVLFRLPAPAALIHLGDVFRASARFFWIAYYLIVLFSIIAVSRLKIGLAAQRVIVILALVIQLFDIFPIIVTRHLAYGPYTTPLDNESWTRLMEPFDHIVFYPPFESHQRVHMDYQDFGFLAARNGKTINIGYVARADGKAMQLYSDSLSNSLDNARPLRSNTLYITTLPQLDHFTLLLNTGLGSLNTLDGYYYIYSNSIHNDSLRGLSRALNTKYRPQLDSGLAAAGKMEEFRRESRLVASKSKPLKYYLEKINVGERFLFAEGWGFIDTTRNNKGDSIFLTLTKDNKTFMAGTQVFKRPDIAGLYSQPDLEDAGFRNIVFFDSLQKGVYQLGLVIKDQQGRLIWQLDDHRISVGYPEYAAPVKVQSLPEAGKIMYDVEPPVSTAGDIRISGWGAFDQQDADNSVISCVLKSGENTFTVETKPVPRPDVTRAAKGKFRLDNSGFKVKVLKDALPKGVYQVGILIRDPVRNKENVIFSSRTVDIP